MTRHNREIWIGLVHVAPRPGNKMLGQAKGSYVNALAEARSREAFIVCVKARLARMDLVFLEVEDVEPFARRLEHSDVPLETRQTASRAVMTKDVEFTTFHSYPGESEETVQ